MCELFGMSSALPVRAVTPLRELGRHGGETADNPDGWGIARLQDERLVIDKAPEPAAQSSRFARLADSVRSTLIVAHVRKANPPTDRNEANTHPFLRDCCGRSWVFAHNGKVATLLEPQGCCQPRASVVLGDTDSERAFCFLLEEIAGVVAAGEAGEVSWVETVAKLGALIATYGRFNFLLSDGDLLLAYGHDRLHLLTQRADRYSRTLIATEPLTPDAWEPFAPGELRVFRFGEQIIRLN
jgi:glutamine amidotransferase